MTGVWKKHSASSRRENLIRYSSESSQYGSEQRFWSVKFNFRTFGPVIEGAAVGEMLGVFVVGVSVGANVGEIVVGFTVGSSVGAKVGCHVVGFIVGPKDG